MPVHSITISTSPQGRSAGLRIAVTCIGPRPTSMVFSVVVTSAGKRPCTLSKRKRWALVSTGPRSLIATTSISVRPDSMIPRSTLRPIRPKPLMATFTVMVSPSRWVSPAGRAMLALTSTKRPKGQPQSSDPSARRRDIRRSRRIDARGTAPPPDEGPVRRPRRRPRSKARSQGRFGSSWAGAGPPKLLIAGAAPSHRPHRPSGRRSPIRCRTRPEPELSACRRPWSGRARR